MERFRRVRKNPLTISASQCLSNPTIGGSITDGGFVTTPWDDFDAAIDDYDDAIAYGCDLSLVYLYRANAFLDSGDLDRAITNYGHAIRRDTKAVNSLHSPRSCV